MSNYAEVFHKCGDRFRDVAKLFSSSIYLARVSGFNSLVIPKIWYKVYESFSDNSEFLASGSICVLRVIEFSQPIIPPHAVYESFDDNTVSFVSSEISVARVIV